MTLRSRFTPIGLRWAILVCAGAAGCDRGPPPVVSPPPAGPFAVGVPLFGANHWIEYVPGDAPLIIIAPHGGSVEPRNLRTRKCEGCLSGIDINTQQSRVRSLIRSLRRPDTARIS